MLGLPDAPSPSSLPLLLPLPPLMPLPLVLVTLVQMLPPLPPLSSTSPEVDVPALPVVLEPRAVELLLPLLLVVTLELSPEPRPPLLPWALPELELPIKAPRPLLTSREERLGALEDPSSSIEVQAVPTPEEK